MFNCSWRQRFSVAGVALALLAVTACSNVTVTVQATPAKSATAVGISGNGTITPMPGSNGTAVTGSSATTCTAVLPGATTASAGSNFTDLPLPANSVSTPVTKSSGGGDGQFTIYEENLCASNTTAQAVFSFFANTLPTKNWPHQKWFPFDGYFYADCGDPYCWASAGNTPPRQVGLEAVTDHGNGIISYHLRFATPPAAPTCDPSVTFLPGYYYNMDDLGKYSQTDVYQKIPFPPLTRVLFTPAATMRDYNLCSAPSIGIISSFMAQHLRANGWTQGTGNVWSNGKYQVSFTFTGNGNWVMQYSDPGIFG